jgi:hypothetical protein
LKSFFAFSMNSLGTFEMSVHLWSTITASAAPPGVAATWISAQRPRLAKKVGFIAISPVFDRLAREGLLDVADFSSAPRVFSGDGG